MNRIWRVFGIALFCAYLAGCAGSSGSSGVETQTGGPGIFGGKPSAEVSEPLFRITQPAGLGADALISHDFQVKNTGGAVLEIIKITPG